MCQTIIKIFKREVKMRCSYLFEEAPPATRDLNRTETDSAEWKNLVRCLADSWTFPSLTLPHMLCNRKQYLLEHSSQRWTLCNIEDLQGLEGLYYGFGVTQMNSTLSNFWFGLATLTKVDIEHWLTDKGKKMTVGCLADSYQILANTGKVRNGA